MQIPYGPRAQRLGLLGVPATTHHENWRLHAKVADVFQQVETLLPAVAYPWNDQVEQNEIERCPQQDVERLGIGIRRYDVVGVPVPKAGKNSSNTPTTFGSSSTMRTRFENSIGDSSAYAASTNARFTGVSTPESANG